VRLVLLRLRRGLAGYLTVSEIFPQEIRGQAISYFFSIAQVVAALGPVLYGALIGDGTDRNPMFWGTSWPRESSP
jgi:MFS family permease